MTTRRKAATSKGTEAGEASDRLYQKLARALFQELASGKYKVGDRLPAERELAIEHEVSRPAVREAMIALEVQGLIEVRIGSGAYVKRLPGDQDQPGFHATAFELTEARLLFESEACALAATNATEQEVRQLERLVAELSNARSPVAKSEAADHAFHMLIAKATRNVVVAKVIEDLWKIRSSSPECALLHEKSRDAGNRPVPDEHRAIVDAIRNRDPGAARSAMRAHLSRVIDYLLFATEERALAEARQSVASARARFGRSAAL